MEYWKIDDSLQTISLYPGLVIFTKNKNLNLVEFTEFHK